MKGRLTRAWRVGGRGRLDVAAQAEVVSRLAALIRGGVPPVTAWAHLAAGTASDRPGAALGVALAQAARASAAGEPVAAQLRRCPQLAELAATWQVAETAGAPVADALDRLAATLAEADDCHRELQAALAGPRATTRVLLALPVAAVGFGYLVGADPLGFLTGGRVGAICGAVGVTFALLGRYLAGRLLTRAGTGLRR